MAVTLSRDESDVIRCFEATCHPFVTKWGNLSKSEMLSADGPRTGEAWHCLVPEAFVAGSVRACQRNQRWEETKVTIAEPAEEALRLLEAENAGHRRCSFRMPSLCPQRGLRDFRIGNSPPSAETLGGDMSALPGLNPGSPQRGGREPPPRVA